MFITFLFCRDWESRAMKTQAQLKMIISHDKSPDPDPKY
jgi:hypothetical protein